MKTSQSLQRCDDATMTYLLIADNNFASAKDLHMNYDCRRNFMTSRNFNPSLSILDI
jgi:hypothetical protein